MGFPAVLKGFVDKVFLPGVSFEIRENGDYVPRLFNIKRLGVVCTYGGSRWKTLLMGDPPRRFLKRSMRVELRSGRARRLSRALRHGSYPPGPPRGLPEQSRGNLFDLVSGHGARITRPPHPPSTNRPGLLSTAARTASI